MSSSRTVHWADLTQFIITTAACILAMFPVAAQQIVMIPDGGRLDARDDAGQMIGPCPLLHTDVNAEISGVYSLVTLRQTYENPYNVGIEAVYTFPMFEDAAVHSMKMIVGDRIVVAEMREREEAKQIYEQAKRDHRVAALLEEERPNILTQSIANIAPGERIEIVITYLEPIDLQDGEYTFTFPMVVGPRYIPGVSTVSRAHVPAELKVRRGLVRRRPGTVRPTRNAPRQPVSGGRINALLTAAVPIHKPDEKWWGEGKDECDVEMLYEFRVIYHDGRGDDGVIFVDATGRLGDRWFFTDFDVLQEMGGGYAQNTNQVPDASRITPLAVRPAGRAGHDVSLSVEIETGGPGIDSIHSDLHEIDVIEEAWNDDGLPTHVVTALKNLDEIPNRDFLLRWKQTAPTITEAVFTHTDAVLGNFVTVVLQPPARIRPEMIRPRELIFVLDTSGSMSGFPIEKAKEVVTRAIGSMRDGDTFNVVTFAGSTDILWDRPRAATRANQDLAIAFINRKQGGGGTEMMEAIRAAMRPSWRIGDGAARSDSDGEVQTERPLRIVMFLTDGYVGNDQAIVDAVQKNARTTRVFSFGIGNSPNRYLLKLIAEAARGEADFVTLQQDADAAVEKFLRRIESPVLTDIEIEWSDTLSVSEVVPVGTNGLLPDLYDEEPIVLHGRYAAAGAGALRVRGMTGEGPYEHVIAVHLPKENNANKSIAMLWARKTIASLMSRDLKGAQANAMDQNIKQQIVELALAFNLMTEFTSFIAVDKKVVATDGVPELINIPVELPEGMADGQEEENARPMMRIVDAQIQNSGVRRGGGGFGGGGGGFGGGGSPFSEGGDPPERIPPEEYAEELIDIVISSIEPDQWEDNGGLAASIRYYKGTFIVYAPPYIHRQVAELLPELQKKRTESYLRATSRDELAAQFVALVTSNRLNDAAALAAWLRAGDPKLALDDALSVYLHDAFENDPAKTDALSVLQDQVHNEMAASAIRVGERSLMRARLDESLRPFVQTDIDFPLRLDPDYDGVTPRGADWIDGGVRVSIIVHELTQEIIGAVRACNVRIDQVVEDERVIRGIAPLGSLRLLVKFHDIRRIEPYRDAEDN